MIGSYSGLRRFSLAPPWTRRWRLNSLRARMALILVCVLLLPTGYAIIQALVLYHENQMRVLNTLERTGDLISSHQSEFFSKTRLLLQALAGNPDVAGARMPKCATLLQTELRKTLDYSNFAVTDEHGIVRCSPAPDMIGVGLADRAWFGRLRNGAAFTISEVVNSRDGRGRAVIAAVALHRKSDGAFSGTLSANVDLRVLDARIRLMELPENALVFLSDDLGELLTASARQVTDLTTGRPSREQIRRLIGDGTGAEVQTKADGEIERRFITTPVPGAPLHVVLGLPVSDRWFRLDRNLVLALFAPSAMLALAIIAIWVATDLLVNRHVAELARTARTYSGGRFDVAPRLAAAPSELRDLAAALVKMGRRVGEREEELRQSLQQKDMLLREIHHRIKNNLQIVTSLLHLRSRSIASPAAQQAMMEAQIRIKALALVHRSLYEHHDLDRLDVAVLTRELCQLLHDSARPGGGLVAMKIDVASIEVTTEKAIPLALLITEAVTNSLKHAFADGRDGTLEIRLTRDGSNGHLVIADDGMGITASQEAKAVDPAAHGTGLNLIRMLAKQISGRLRMEGPPGTRVSLDFAT